MCASRDKINKINSQNVQKLNVFTLNFLNKQKKTNKSPSELSFSLFLSLTELRRALITSLTSFKLDRKKQNKTHQNCLPHFTVPTIISYGLVRNKSLIHCS